jgi:hypothetical protein
MTTQSAVSAWPAAPEASVAYVEISDYFGMIFHRDVTAASCPSCHTVNRGRVTRCRACGEAMPSAVDEQIEAPLPRGANSKADLFLSNSRPLRNVLLLVLAPAVLLSSAFVGWQMSRAASTTLSEPARLVQAHPIAPNAPLPALGLRKQLQEIAMTTPEASPSVTNVAPWPEEPAVKSGDYSDGKVAAPSSFSTRKAQSRPRAVRVTSDPLAACRSQGFFARAICINTRCAEPGASRFGQCRQAIRQRKIDEARRNPTLMG